MGLTSAQRYNKRLEKIFAQARDELPSTLNNFYWRKGKIVKRVKGWKKKGSKR